MSETMTLVAPERPMLAYLPVGLFGSVMGLRGLSVAWRLAQARYGAPGWIALVIAAAAVLVFVSLLAGYTIKLATAPGAVRAEFRHPIAGNLFGTVLISLLLLPIVVAPSARHLAQAVWAAGAAGMIVFAWVIVSRWMSDRQQVAHATPAWIIPVVGLLDVPLALPSLGLPSLHGLMVFALAVGLFFAVLAVLLGQLRYLRACCPFRVSWWAVSFPLAASSIAALRFAVARRGLVTDGVAIALLALATVVIAALFGRTVLGLFRGELRRLST